jgi:hypothetical protein
MITIRGKVDTLRSRLIIVAALSSLVLLGRPAEPANERRPIVPLAVHAHRYQDFQRNRVICEVFGEIKNTGSQPVKSFTLHLEMLDSKGKRLTQEDLTLPLRVIVPGNAKGEPRPVNPQEIGNFIQDTENCPDQWLEGRIKYSIKAVQTE